MTEQEFHRLVKRISESLQTQSMCLLAAYLKKEEDTSDVLNIILSTHMSSLFSLMMLFSEEHPPIKHKVEGFVENMKKAISIFYPICEIKSI